MVINYPQNYLNQWNRSQGEGEWTKRSEKMVKIGGKMGGCIECELY